MRGSGLRAWVDERLPIGILAGRSLWPPLRLPDHGLGHLTSPPVATRFHIGPGGRGFPAGIGARAHAAHFGDSPPFVVKVRFACIGTDLLRRGPYADPRSPWHNVFFGAYEVRVHQDEWDRPFGFEGPGDHALPRGEDVVRLGKADWNDLSNGLYGVPRHVAAPHDPLGSARWWHEGAEELGGASWQRLSFSGATAVSAWRNPADGGALEDVSPWIGWLWRRVFGVPKGVPPMQRPSFAPVQHQGRFWLRHLACRSRLTGRPCYRTLVAGTVAREDHPDVDLSAQVLEAQRQALQPFLERAGTLRGRP